jgi:hypothetical protein
MTFMCVNARWTCEKLWLGHIVTLCSYGRVSKIDLGMRDHKWVLNNFSFNQFNSKGSSIIIGYEAGHFIIRVHGFSHHVVVVKE